MLQNLKGVRKDNKTNQQDQMCITFPTAWIKYCTESAKNTANETFSTPDVFLF